MVTAINMPLCRDQGVRTEQAEENGDLIPKSSLPAMRQAILIKVLCSRYPRALRFAACRRLLSPSMTALVSRDVYQRRMPFERLLMVLAALINGFKDDCFATVIQPLR